MSLADTLPVRGRVGKTKVAISGEEAGAWVNKNILDRSTRGGHSLRTAYTGLGDGLVGAPGKLGGSAGGWTAEKLKEILLGKKSTEGVFAGKRLHSRATGNAAQDIASGNLKAIPKELADKITSGDIKGQVTKGTVGGKNVFYKTKYSPKGLVGWGLRNKGKAGLAALAAYMLLKPEGRQVAGGVAGGLAQPMRGPSGPTKDFQREWSQPQQARRPVLNDQAWG